MLETQIKALSESVQANTAMLEKLLAAMTVTEIKSQIEAEPKAEPKAEPGVTANDLKGLAKDAIAEGVLRTDIKKLITDAGADTISALNDTQRLEVFNALTKLKGE